MRKIYLIAFTVLATLALGSCVREIQDDNSSLTPVGDNGIAFVMKGGVATRAGEVASVSKGVSIPLGVTEDGTSLYLEETVTQLDAAPITRGTPAYTENLGVLYANQLRVKAEGGSFGEEVFETTGQPEEGNPAWRYVHTYAADPWPESETTPVSFYLQMPATINGFTTTAGGTTVTATPVCSDETIVFDYVSPATAAQMQDILFGYLSINNRDYKKTLPNGAPVTVYHALTGVKFAIGNTTADIADNKITIDTISFVGLKDAGTCTIALPSSGTPTSANVASWEIDDEIVNSSLTSGKYSDTVTFKASGSFGPNGGNYAESFASAGNVRNLGDVTATQTFWLIPQAMTDNVKLRIAYTFAGKQSVGFLEIGKALAGITWKPGELRTYTIRVEDVNLKIEDKVAAGTGDNKVLGSKKNDIVITNTGNTEVFIRAAIVGQWLDDDNNPVFGFTDKVNKLYLVESWYEDQFVSHSGEHGVFVDLPGYWNKTVQGHNTEATAYTNPTNNWKYNSEDGYYYYTKVVAPGKATGETGVDANTGNLLHDPLFTSYTVSKVPKAEIGGVELKDVSMHFTLEIATQAISARKSNGEVLDDSDYAAAWAAALQGNKLTD